MNKEYTKLFRTLAAWFLIREKQAEDRKDYGAATAYANAYDMVGYTMEQNKDCLCQFDDMDEAIQFAFDNRNASFWELEEIYKGWKNE